MDRYVDEKNERYYGEKAFPVGDGGFYQLRQLETFLQGLLQGAGVKFEQQFALGLCDVAGKGQHVLGMEKRPTNGAGRPDKELIGDDERFQEFLDAKCELANAPDGTAGKDKVKVTEADIIIAATGPGTGFIRNTDRVTVSAVCDDCAEGTDPCDKKVTLMPVRSVAAQMKKDKNGQCRSMPKNSAVGKEFGICGTGLVTADSKPDGPDGTALVEKLAKRETLCSASQVDEVLHFKECNDIVGVDNCYHVCNFDSAEGLTAVGEAFEPRCRSDTPCDAKRKKFDEVFLKEAQVKQDDDDAPMVYMKRIAGVNRETGAITDGTSNDVNEFPNLFHFTKKGKTATTLSDGTVMVRVGDADQVRESLVCWCLFCLLVSSCAYVWTLLFGFV